MVLLHLTYLHEEAHFIKALFRNVVNLFDSVFSFSRNKLLDLPLDSGAVTNQEYYETVVTESSRYVAFWEMFLQARANVHCFKNSKQSVVTLDSSLNTVWNTKVTSYQSGCLCQQKINFRSIYV